MPSIFITNNDLEVGIERRVLEGGGLGWNWVGRGGRKEGKVWTLKTR